MSGVIIGVDACCGSLAYPILLERVDDPEAAAK